MTRVWRKMIKWSLRIIAVIGIIIAILIAILAFPQPFFSHYRELDHCQIYSDEEITPQLAEILTDVDRRMQALNLQDLDTDNRVFLCHSQNLYNFFARLSMVTPLTQGYNLSVVGNSFVSMTRISEMRAASGGFPPYFIHEGNPAHTIVHELTHQYIVDLIGYSANRKVPPMKLEGLAEYGSSIAPIRNDTTYTLPRRIDILRNDSYWNPGYDRARDHYRAGLVVEYLSEVKGYRFADILADSLTLDAGYREMIDWRASAGSN